MERDVRASRQPLWKRLLWFVGLWLSGLAAVGAVAAVLRFWLSP